MRTAAALTSIAVLALSIINPAVAADTAEGAKSVAVHFADLDLSKTEGKQRCSDGSSGLPGGSARSLDSHPWT
jgi:UrcA family protein